MLLAIVLLTEDVRTADPTLRTGRGTVLAVAEVDAEPGMTTRTVTVDIPVDPEVAPPETDRLLETCAFSVAVLVTTPETTTGPATAEDAPAPGVELAPLALGTAVVAVAEVDGAFVVGVGWGVPEVLTDPVAKVLTDTTAPGAPLAVVVDTPVVE